MYIQTSRLELVPLTKQQMHQWTKDPKKVAVQLRAVAPELPLLERLSYNRVYRAKIGLMEDDPEREIFSTYFLMVRRSDRQIIGEIGYKGISRNGETEIGYGTFDAYQHNGYMTEAVRALTDWALHQEDYPVKAVTARAKKENIFSQKVLQHSGFRMLYLNLGITNWKKDL